MKEANQFYCKICAPADVNQRKNEEAHASITSNKVDGGYKCDKCRIIVKSNYSLKRHVTRIHDADNDTVEKVENVETIPGEQGQMEIKESEHEEHVVKQTNGVKDILGFLKSIGLEQYLNVFQDNDMELPILLDLREEEFMDMVKDLGIKSWAHRHKIKRAIEALKPSSKPKKDS